MEAEIPRNPEGHRRAGTALARQALTDPLAREVAPRRADEQKMVKAALSWGVHREGPTLPPASPADLLSAPWLRELCGFLESPTRGAIIHLERLRGHLCVRSRKGS